MKKIAMEQQEKLLYRTSLMTFNIKVIDGTRKNRKFQKKTYSCGSRETFLP